MAGETNEHDANVPRDYPELLDAGFAYIPYSVLWRALLFPIRNFLRLFLLAWVPLSVSFVVLWLVNTHLPPMLGVTIPVLLFHLYLNCMFAVAIHRWIVTGKPPKGFAYFGTGRAEFVYMGAALLLLGLVAATNYTLKLAMEFLPSGVPMFIALWSAISIFFLAAQSLLLIFPAAALTGRFRPGLSYYKMKGNFWLTVFIFALLGLLAGALTYVLSDLAPIADDARLGFDIWFNLAAFPVVTAFSDGPPNLPWLAADRLYGLYMETTLIAALSYMYRYAMT